jgi:RNA polymerase sigma-70 factor (ECF subfamily)
MSDQAQDRRWRIEVQGGSQAALESLLRRHASPLLNFLRRLAGDAHLAEELVQETFLAVWEHRRSFDPTRAFKPWLYAIAVNQFRATLRREPRHDPGDAESLALSREPDPADVLVDEETVRRLDQALHRLPSKQRAVVCLRAWEGMSFAQIGEAIGCSEGTARSHMHHALAGLRQVLERPASASRDPRKPTPELAD